MAAPCAAAGIRVECEPGIRIFLNDRLQGLSTAEAGGLMLPDLAAGTHTLKAVKPGFLPRETTITLAGSEVRNWKIEKFMPLASSSQEDVFAPPPAETKTGTLVLTTLPLVADIRIPALGVEQRKDQEEWRLEAIPAGDYEVRVFGLGSSLSQHVRIAEDATSRFFFDLLAGKVEDLNPAKGTGEPYAVGDFVLVRGGCFQMGDVLGNGQADEQPVHEVCLGAFEIGRHEVTQALWEEVMGSNPSRFKEGGRYPVENVSWDEVQQFIKKLNRETGAFHRLPTEAEWEYACRSGGSEEPYCGGQNPDLYGWHAKNSDGQIHPVGQKQANGLGIHDMSGNVWEWCQDWYGEHAYAAARRNNPSGVATGSYRVIRGGSWSFPTKSLRATGRDRRPPAYGFDFLGFRLVRPAQQR